MIVLDENIPDSQRQLLRSWRIRIQQIGQELSGKGLTDADVLRILHRLRFATLFTRDLGFYRQGFCHANYGVVCLAVRQQEVASFVRRVLRHSEFNTRTQRMGKILRVSHRGIQFWQLPSHQEAAIAWMP